MSKEPYIKTQGIVLKTFPYSETSCITNIFTREHGVLPCLIKGVRSKNARTKLAYFKELAILSIELKKYKNSEFYYATDTKVAYIYSYFMTFFQDLNKGCIYMFITELINKCIRDGVQSEELYDFLYNALMALDECERVSLEFHIIFMIQFAQHFGFALNFEDYSDNCVFDIPEGRLTKIIPAHGKYIPNEYVNLINEAIYLNSNDRISGCNTIAIRRNLISYMEQFYSYHFPRFGDLKSIHVIRQILDAGYE